MDKILGVLAGDGLASSRNDDDFTDRLQYRFTTMLLIMFAIVVTTNTYVGKLLIFSFTFLKTIPIFQLLILTPYNYTSLEFLFPLSCSVVTSISLNTN